MAFPEWVIKHREPKTEIKFINGGYYKYQVSYRYNPQKKRTDKITGVLLGKITEEDGFVSSDKHKLRMTHAADSIDIKGYGLSRLFFHLIEPEFEMMKTFLPDDVCEIIFSFAMYRWAYNSPIKRIPYYYHHDFSSLQFTHKRLTDKKVSYVLKAVGENRTAVVSWMKSLLNTSPDEKTDRFVMMDSTHVVSKSELLAVNAQGYNSNFDFDEQIRLMYLFSTEIHQPVYYRLINGNITDVKSMTLCVEEMKVEGVIYIADKGFYSKGNIEIMEKEKLQYIIPLKRDSSRIDYEPLQAVNFKEKLSYFTYQGRIIWYYEYQNEGDHIVTYLNEGLRAKEESDYVNRIEKLPEKYSKEKFIKKLPGFGTLSFIYSIRSKKSCEEIYHAYKQRNEIEVTFDAYKNFLKADLMYMQNRYVTEGWLTANFIAMLAYHKLFSRMRTSKKLSKYSPKDLIEMCKSIYKLKIGKEWKTSEITKRTADLFLEIDLDYLK